MPKLKIGNIIICFKDFYIPGTGVTFYFYKGKEYIIKDFFPKVPNCYYIELKGKHSWDESGFFSEEELFEKFDCVKYQRKEKLKKLNSYE